ncbi:MAG TPA: DUF4276 family protein [Pyrinomonadaceae bacterium]
MVKDIKLYVEGGGKGSHKVATIKLQQGFDSFFRELKAAARENKISFRIIPAGNTQSTYDEFILSVENSPASFNILLVDSDQAVDETPRLFLQKKYKEWNLQTVTDEQCHLFVEIMESWFLADKDNLAEFYGKNFNRKALAKTANVEKIAKATVESGLENATKNTQKGVYHKIQHGAKLLELISPQKVRDAAPHCDRLFETISEKINE